MSERRPARNVRPGEILREELKARGWSAHKLAMRSGLALIQVQQLLAGELTITAAVAECLSKGLGVSAETWRNLQRSSDEWEATK